MAHVGDNATDTEAVAVKTDSKRMEFEGSLKLSLFGTQNLGEIYS